MTALRVDSRESTFSPTISGVGAADPATFGLVLALLGLVPLSACSVPAMRAARVDPMTALRQE